MTFEEAKRISAELWKSGTEWEELLRAKCRWEQMTRTKVLMEWGHPKDWEARDF